MKIFEKLLGKKEEKKIVDPVQPNNESTEENPNDPLEKQLKTERFLTHLSTDKPIYRGGDKMYIRGVVLHGLTRTPHPDLATKMRTKSAVLEIISPSGDSVFKTEVSNGNQSVLSAFWDIPKDQAGGDYKAKIAWRFANFPPAEREFNIRSFRNPRIKTQIKFEKKGYGTNDEAVAILNVKRAEGDVPKDALISASARIDGNEVFSKEGYQLDDEGNVRISFKIPSEITEGDGTLSCRIQDGGTVENASQTIPILLQKMDIRIYAEGGDFVEGVKNRFYVEAFTRTGDPADIFGEITENEGGKVVGTVGTVHEGRGKSEFTPQAGKGYHLKILKPSGIINTEPFPPALTKGVHLSSLQDTSSSESENVDFQLISNHDFEGNLSLFRTKVALDHVKVTLKAFEAQKFSLKSQMVSGVLRATLFDNESKPVSERIVFKHPKKKLFMELKSEKKDNNYTPGGKVSLKVVTKDENGKSVKAFVGITVTDDSVLEMVEKRKQTPRLPEMALLESEVDHLHDCQFYFNEQEEKNNLSIDLLLGTQGWRRFVFFDAEKRNQIPLGKKQRLTIAKDEEPMPVTALNNAIGGGGRGGPIRKKGMVEGRQLMASKIVQKKEAPPKPPQDPQPILQAEKEQILPPAPAANFPVQAVVEGKSPPQAEMKKSLSRRAPAAPAAPAAAIAPLRRMPSPMVNTNQVVMREFAHLNRPGRIIGERTDFTETLYWNSCLETDSNGKGSFSFDLNDSVSSFKVLLDGFSNEGGLGSHQTLLESREPFYLEAKLPLEVTEGDEIQLPISLVNSLTEDINGNISINIDGEGLHLKSDSSFEFNLAADKRERRMVDLSVSRTRATPSIKVSGSSKHASDSVTRSLSINPKGFPMSIHASGMIAPSETLTHTFSLPQELVDGSADTHLKIYTNPAGSLTEAVKSLNRTPCGCFEQTSMTTYPLVMAVQYLKSHQLESGGNSLLESCLDNLKKGYDRLKGYECKSGGFDWFGADPGHEALSAYGLMQFIEMKKVMDVDEGMIERTVNWLQKRRDPKGGFQRNTKALDKFGGAPAEHTNAYITWALTEAGIDTSKDVDFVIQECANKKNDAYIWALTSLCLYKNNRREDAIHWARKIAELQKESGEVSDEETSITRSGGGSLIVEATALSVLAWLQDDENFGAISSKAINHLSSSCKNGNFGSTQATLLSLKAIVEFDKKRSSGISEGALVISVNGEETSRIRIDEKPESVLSSQDFASKLRKGENTVSLQMLNGGKFPYSLAIDFCTIKGDSSEECAVRLETKLVNTVVQEGKSTEVKVVIQNVTDNSLPMTLAVVGIPGGLEPRIDKLKELVKSGTIDYYETLGQRIALYWRFMEPKEKKEFLFDVVAAIPGSYTGPASSAYLYYTNEDAWWNEGLSVKINP